MVLLCSMRTKEPKSRRAEDWKEALLREEKKNLAVNNVRSAGFPKNTGYRTTAEARNPLSDRNTVHGRIILFRCPGVAEVHINE